MSGNISIVIGSWGSYSEFFRFRKPQAIVLFRVYNLHDDFFNFIFLFERDCFSVALLLSYFLCTKNYFEFTFSLTCVNKNAV